MEENNILRSSLHSLLNCDIFRVHVQSNDASSNILKKTNAFDNLVIITKL